MTLPAMFDSILRDSEFSGPCGNRQAFAVPFDRARIRAIRVLLVMVGPSAILRRVAFRVVDAVNGMFQRRPWSHVGVEVGEGTPALSNDQSFGSVTFKQRIFRVVAALNDVRPYVVFAGLIKAMLRASLCDKFSIKAAARNLSSMKRIAFDVQSFPAFTSAYPVSDFVWVMRGVRCSFNDSQSAVNVACSVYDWASHKTSLSRLGVI